MNPSIYKVIQEKDIIIFGKNSIIAKNFTDSFKNSNNQIISLTRDNPIGTDIFCSLDQKISERNLNNICSEISDFCKYKKKVFILFAWSGRPRTNLLNDEAWKKNQNIIINFLEISKKLKPLRIIFISSTSLYPENENHNFTELDKTKPETLYSKQKLIAEKEIEDFSIKNNIEFSILRVSSAYGFDNRFIEQGVINKWLYDAIKSREIRLLNSKDSKINFISFDQISKAIAYSINTRLVGTFNIASQKSVSLEKIIDEIERVTRKKLMLKTINNKKRNINIDTSKFYKATGIKFENEVIKNIDSIYSSIMKELNI